MIARIVAADLAPRDAIAEVDLLDGTHLVFSDLPEVLAARTLANRHVTVIAFLDRDAEALPESAAVTVVRPDRKGAAASEVAWALAVSLDVYVVAALRVERDVAVAIGLMVLTNVAAHSVEAIPGLRVDGRPVWWLLAAASALPPVVLWRIHRLAGHGDQAADQADQHPVTRLVTDPDQRPVVDQPVTGILTSPQAVDQPVDQDRDQVDQPVTSVDQVLTGAREGAREEHSGAAREEHGEEHSQEQPEVLAKSTPAPLAKSGLTSTSKSSLKSGPASTAKSATGGRGAGLPRRVKSARELSDEQLAELWRAWSLVTERPSTRAGAVHFAMDQARAARVRALAEETGRTLHVVQSS
jgi:hypothetical protein